MAPALKTPLSWPVQKTELQNHIWNKSILVEKLTKATNFNNVSQAILPCIHVDREIIAVMVLTKGINKF
jgi:hypothetical protein